MRLQDFRVGLRLLVKDPVYSLVSILGLGVGLGVCLLLLGYARYCWSYNTHVPDADHVYVVKQRNNLQLGTPWYDQAPLMLLAAARSAPGVRGASGYVGWCPLTLEVGGQLRGLNSLTVLPGFAAMMGLKVLQGDLEEALSRPDAIAMTEGAARRLFGTPQVLGKTVQLRLNAVDENRSMARIAAIVRDPPANTTIPFETLNGSELALIPPVLHQELVGASQWPGYLLVRLQPGASPAAVGAVLQRAVDESPDTKRLPPDAKERLGNRPIMDVQLSPLREAYFDQGLAANFLSLPVDRGDRAVVAGLVAVAVLILALAALNYVNLATLRMVRRQREIAMRKVLGTGQGRLVLQLLAESLLVSMLATAVGLALACLALPVFSQLMNRDLGSLLSLESVAAALLLGVMLGLVTALYPAWIAVGVRPSLLLMGRPDTESLRARWVRQLLSVLQVSTAMGLAAFTLAVSWQARFALTVSPGFDPSPLLVIDLPKGVSARDEKPRGLIAALSQRPEVAGIAVSNDPVGRSQEPWSTQIQREGQAAVTLDVKSVSASFFEEYGIAAVAGRLFNPSLDTPGSTPIVLDALAARQLGFASPALAVGQSLLLKTQERGAPVMIPQRIIGIAPEIRFHSLRETQGAIAYEITGTGEGWDGTVTVRARGSVAAAGQAVRELWPRYFPNAVPEMQPAREIYAANYADDERLARLLGFATGVAMLIAAFGVYVLAADSVQRRTREIALRKLFGTRRRDIARRVAGELGSVILLSAAMGLPLAALAIARYLAPYAQQTPWAWWALGGALAAAVGLAALAGARQTWRAMMIRPALVLRAASSA